MTLGDAASAPSSPSTGHGLSSDHHHAASPTPLTSERRDDSQRRHHLTTERRTFTQYYGSSELDASVLNIPLVGFLPGTDERVTGTIDAVWSARARWLRVSLLDRRDGRRLEGDEGQFLACSFWLVSALALNGRIDDARTLFERLLGLATTSACSPRNTTSHAGGRSATSRRRSATSR